MANLEDGANLGGQAETGTTDGDETRSPGADKPVFAEMRSPGADYSDVDDPEIDKSDADTLPADN